MKQTVRILSRPHCAKPRQNSTSRGKGKKVVEGGRGRPTGGNCERSNLALMAETSECKSTESERDRGGFER